MKATPAGGLLVGLAIAAVIGAVVWAAIRGQGKDWEVAAEIDRGVMTDYCRLVGEGRYGEAWETCLTASYREEVPREKFVSAHEKRRAEVGTLGGSRLLRADLTRNLFSRTRELHLLYELTYPGRAEREYAKVNDADGTWRIEGTYHLNAAETYDFLLW
ncbi:MAG: hypothetical protein IPN03_14885 [Holophagales bacterium]|nr:hypothetical protein [Holophagales bacterium]